jgi:hypothetical protein
MIMFLTRPGVCYGRAPPVNAAATLPIDGGVLLTLDYGRGFIGRLSALLFRWQLVFGMHGFCSLEITR